MFNFDFQGITSLILVNLNELSSTTFMNFGAFSKILKIINLALCFCLLVGLFFVCLFV